MNRMEGYPASRVPKVHAVKSLEDLLPYACFLVRAPEWRRNKVGFVGHGKTKPRDRVPWVKRELGIA